MPKSSFGSIRLCFQAADDDENGGFVITLMYQCNGKGSVGLTPELSVMIAPPRVIECPVQMETTVERISPFDATNPKVRTSIVSIELKVIAVHAHPGIRMEGHANRIDPDRWNPLIMNFR
jgi:flavin reductase (DIM6/NTAB) family NADH-FMN oxidoreductase RutF